MKTKLDLYIGVQNLAVETLADKSPVAEARIDAFLKPLNLVPDERNRFSQLFYSRRCAMLDLQDKPLEVVQS